MRKTIVAVIIMVLAMMSCGALADSGVREVEEEILLTPDGEEILIYSSEQPEYPAREDLINRIIALGGQLYDKANGRPQRAASGSDIYVCKNFTTYLFRKCRDDFRIEEYPNVTLVCPDNMPAEGCAPYVYGVMWKDVPASEGNPFYAAAEFRYDNSLTYEENLEIAKEFMRQVKRGDYFQMAADYYYGVGAHSAIMIADWNPETDTVRWMDSNMAGKRIDGVRYGYVQYDREKSVTWWAEAFCHKRYGATIYRIREDIVYAE